MIKIFNNIFGFSTFLIYSSYKEVFVNNSFETIETALITLEKNAIYRKEVNINTLKQSPTKEYSINNYINDNRENIDFIVNYLKENNLEYSWLQILQILILKDKYSIEESILKLKEFYEEQNKI